ncbi:ImmA/IrrE family metallo-endopeptidase [Candidatus Palauibacter sp.]|uniref:ImmA/IrrE family metallo-endopeptidase n=1 Tax=Candidatus Palauibacter sp. TaxID=3101350 RepID=UPI003B5C7677
MTRVPVSPEMLRWACERAGYEVADVAARVPQLQAWVRREGQPTLKQLEKLAKVTHTPLGYLFLPEPPAERLPVPDYRTVAGTAGDRPSPDLLDTLYTMRRRQEWFRESLVDGDAEPLAFVACARLTDQPDAAGREMRRALGLDAGWAARVRTWRDAVSELRRTIEQLGVMAVINGVVGNNTRRPLSVKEFRGFALTDPYAPLIFVNGADAKSAQMFTLAHELAHIWLGREGLSGFEALSPGGTDVEDWCNQAAAELLAPEREVTVRWRNVKREADRFEALARTFKVSPVVAARRALDLDLIDRSTFFDFYERYVKQEHRSGTKQTGGNFYNNQNTRVGELFATQVLRAAMEGRIGFKHAYDLTGLRGGTFQKYARRLGVDRSHGPIEQGTYV